MKNILNIFFLLFLYNSFSQNFIIKGKILDEEKKPLYKANVIIYDNDKILGFSISDLEGNYKIEFTTLSNIIRIEIKYFNFNSISEIITCTSKTLNYTLRQTLTQLKEVIVQSEIIKKKGDTISYNISAYANEKDRSVADVLSKMPDITVLSDGKILYQGRPINKYYIEGLDLLDGKYNLVNKNLPYNQVAKIQVLENHQPIKILDSLIFSDNAALNIKLKKSTVFTGQAEIGSGFSPLLYKSNITPMIFGKKRQTVSSYQTNNTGENLEKQLKILTIENILENLENNLEKRDWLSIQKLSEPILDEKRWLDNNTHLVSGNFLEKLKKNYEFHFNIDYLNNFKKQNGYSETRYYTQNDTIYIRESKRNKSFNNNLTANFSLQKNTKKNYFKNTLIFKGYWDSQNGVINLNENIINENLKNDFYLINNSFKMIFLSKKQLFTLESKSSYSKTPQYLEVYPGQFSNLLNEGNFYFKTRQNLFLNNFFLNNSISFTKLLNRFTISPKVGFLIENNNLQTNVLVNNETKESIDFKNNLLWYKTNFYGLLQTQYKKNSWKIELNTPINFYNFKWQNLQTEKNNMNYLTFEPRLTIINEISTFWKISSSFGVSNKFGEINNLYNGYILQNYRNIQRFNSILPQTISKNINLGLFYKNIINSWFGSAFYTYSNIEDNILYSSIIQNSGAIQLESIEKNNNKNNNSISTRLNKYFSKIKTSFTFNSSYSWNNSFQILNNELSKIYMSNINFEFNLDSQITNWLELKHNINYNLTKNKIQTNENKSIINKSYLLDLTFYPKENNYFTIKSEFFENNSFLKNESYFFLDFKYNYNWKKKNIDFELLMTNILNKKNYRTINVSDFSYIETNFVLRPRQILFKTRFSL